jgi:hypothetical protein
MNIHDKIRHTFRKHPNCRLDRKLAYWFIGVDHYDFMPDSATQIEILAFFKDFAAIERGIREILKEPEFRLKEEENQKRYQKASEFREGYRKNEVV